MSENTHFDVIIVGGSYAGLAAAMALGRALKSVLIIDSGKPCNRQTPYSHNFITQDGESPAAIAALAKRQVSQYDTIAFFDGLAISGRKTGNGFAIEVQSGEIFTAKKLLFATGIRDIMPSIDGLEACWGMSVLHCPYCHGYEVRQQKTGILYTETIPFDFIKLLFNWTQHVILFTNGPAPFTEEQTEFLKRHSIQIVEKVVKKLAHTQGHLEHILFQDGTASEMQLLYAPLPFEQHCKIPQSLGGGLTEEGYLQIDLLQETTIQGVYACGDNVSRMRTLANAVGMGTTAGMTISRQLILEEY